MNRQDGLPFQRVALVLQGGGALGAYQGGVAQGLLEAGLHLDWVAGVSIGAINAALIAGNPPERRLARLREFWETICRPAYGQPTSSTLEAAVEPLGASPGCGSTGCTRGGRSPRASAASSPRAGRWPGGRRTTRRR
ncbi:patatin-like phospholipase family protein [Aquabacterium sp. J223]|nr:patatin-like phospholipase family protein [Aquabacterium sp. J223]UUX96564.1 patatin-like phospholipase family protein [Aquabacterium sp. J223]